MKPSESMHPVVDLNTRKTPPRPCPSSVIAVIGVERPTRIRCGEAEGHAGVHRYVVEWTN